MKYLSILIILMSGCAHISEYNQGCRDGVTELTGLRGTDGKTGGVNDVGVNREVTAYFCDMLDGRRDREKNK